MERGGRSLLNGLAGGWVGLLLGAWIAAGRLGWGAGTTLTLCLSGLGFLGGILFWEKMDTAPWWLHPRTVEPGRQRVVAWTVVILVSAGAVALWGLFVWFDDRMFPPFGRFRPIW